MMEIVPPTADQLAALTDYEAFALGARYGACAVRQRLLRMIRKQEPHRRLVAEWIERETGIVVAEAAIEEAR